MQPGNKLPVGATVAALFFVSPTATIEGASASFVCDTGGWDVTPSEAYAWSHTPPQGCSCQATGVSLKDCEIFDCGCVCDMTAGQCDMNCCCDAECTKTELERFVELDACLEEGSLDTINPRYPLTGGGAAESAIDGLLCVQYDNSGSKGEFLEDPGTLPTTIFSDSAGLSEFSYHDLLIASSGTGATEGDATFDKGDRIPAAFLGDGGGTVAAFGGFFPVEISSTTWLDWDTGQESEFDYVNCGAFYYGGAGASTVYSNCSMGGGSANVSTAVTNTTEGCKNALSSVCYTILHDGEGSVTRVSAALVLTDIPVGIVASSQRFSVEFRLDETSDAFSALTQSQDLGNLVKRARSGNPGYLPGLPVLAGRLQSWGDYEYMAAGGSAGGGGLELMAGQGRGCEDVGTSAVEFGYDGLGCCVLSLSRDALEQHCTGSGQHVDPDTGFTPLAFRNTSSAVEYIGKYGSADPLDVSQWMELPLASSADTASWDDERAIASDFRRQPSTFNNKPTVTDRHQRASQPASPPTNHLRPD
eukprot:jgi/Undpi1/3934/HiC_scaffold_16.g07302.m1